MKAYLNQNGRCGRRGGFTVVEILVAITVIAILAAMLIPVVGGAMRRANEFAIQSEMSQLDLAIEHFKSDNGFYPPSFARINGAADLMPYLNRIAPNHAYTQNQLADWWINVGEHVEHHGGADLVFWLSGIAKNKQYPFGLKNVPIPNTNPVIYRWPYPNAYDPISDLERNLYFEFASSRVNFDGDGSGAANYLQAKGKISPYQYIDSASYGSTVLNVKLPDFHGYHSVVNGERQFFNPNSFQLVANGLDGLPGGPVLNNGNYSDVQAKSYACTGLVNSGNLAQTTPTNLSPLTEEENNGSGMDNIVNFIGEGSGKLETKALGID